MIAGVVEPWANPCFMQSHPPHPSWITSLHDGSTMPLQDIFE